LPPGRLRLVGVGKGMGQNAQEKGVSVTWSIKSKRNMGKIRTYN